MPCAKSVLSNSSWQPSWLPKGFVLAHTSSVNGEDMLTYTDGIASFTLFVKLVANSSLFKQGIARRGATTAIMSLVSVGADSVGVVLVGEVPVSTAQQVVMSVSVRAN